MSENEVHPKGANIKTSPMDHRLNALLRALGRREGWLEEHALSVERRPRKWLANEIEKGHRILETYMAEATIPPRHKSELEGCLYDLWHTDYSDLSNSLCKLDDYAYFKWVGANRSQLDEMDGIVGAYNLCVPKARRRPLQSVRLSAIEQLRQIKVVCYSHSWQGPYKAALLIGKDRALPVEFSDRQSLLFTEPVRTQDHSIWRDYMRTERAELFAQTLQSTVDPRNLTPLQRLMIEVLQQDNLAA